jgi:hypothetical protein
MQLCFFLTIPSNNIIMKTIKLNNMKNIFSAVVVLTIMLLLSSCARKIVFQTSSVVPAAEGTVKVKKDNNNNYNIQIHIMHLADSKRLQPPKQTYVVWMVTDQNVTKNIGQINSSTKFLSSKLKASFETVTAFKPGKIFITAEDEAGIQNNSGQIVLTTDKF